MNVECFSIFIALIKALSYASQPYPFRKRGKNNVNETENQNFEYEPKKIQNSCRNDNANATRLQSTHEKWTLLGGLFQSLFWTSSDELAASLRTRTVFQFFASSKSVGLRVFLLYVVRIKTNTHFHKFIQFRFDFWSLFVELLVISFRDILPLFLFSISFLFFNFDFRFSSFDYGGHQQNLCYQFGNSRLNRECIRLCVSVWFMDLNSSVQIVRIFSNWISNVSGEWWVC